MNRTETQTHRVNDSKTVLQHGAPASAHQRSTDVGFDPRTEPAGVSPAGAYGSDNNGLDDLFDRVNSLIADKTVAESSAGPLTRSDDVRPLDDGRSLLESPSNAGSLFAGESAESLNDVRNELGHEVVDVAGIANRVDPSQAESNETAFRPPRPQTLRDTGLRFEEVERLILKFLLQAGSEFGRSIASQLKLPHQVVEPILRQLKTDQLIAYKGAGQAGDYEFISTERGRERGRNYAAECSYFGSAPVLLNDYIAAVKAQTMAEQSATEADLKEAFSDLIIDQTMLERLGPAVNSGRGMFLFGEPGNGKTSIAERVTSCFGSTIWIPRCLGIDGDFLRIFDPGVHETVEEEYSGGILDACDVDERWIKIVRPTVIAGGELTMAQLEVCQNRTTRICEAPLQLKSNCGTLVIDDFGRQRMAVDELLNRWIVPLEKRYDFLNMPSGKKIQVPFDQLIVFSTNLEPKDLVDGAFLRRIPYKIEAKDPTEQQFRDLFAIMTPIMGFEPAPEAVDYLIETHYKKVNRPFRACQPRDLLLQVRNYCAYKVVPKVLSPDAFDFAVDNYFAVM